MRSVQGPIDEALEWLTILITPPELAGGSMQAAELELIRDQQRQAVDGRFDDDVLVNLTRSGWLRQDVQVRGAYISTVGLRARLDHPELAMLNVPAGAVDWIAC